MKNFFTGKTIAVNVVIENSMPEATKMSPFDIIKNINSKKAKLSIEELKQSYLPYIINKAFSQSRDTIFFANEMNIYHSGLSDDLIKRMSYDFYYHILPKSQKYSKWQKKNTVNEELLSLIQAVYQYSPKKARDVLPLFIDKKEYLTAFLDTGGRIK